MAHFSHKGTVGHSIGASIIGRDQPPGTSKATQVKIKSEAAPPAGLNHEKPTGGQWHEMRIKRHDNGGFTVEHRIKAPTAKDPYKEDEKSSAFTNARDAHAHVGDLMGLDGDNDGD